MKTGEKTVRFLRRLPQKVFFNTRLDDVGWISSFKLPLAAKNNSDQDTEKSEQNPLFRPLHELVKTDKATNSDHQS